MKLKDSGGGIKLKEHRLFATKEDAEKNITKPSNKPLRRSPYDYMRGYNETAIIDYNRNQTYNDACRLHGQ